jgi:hypothetical protein
VSGPSLSVGLRCVRASIGVDGKANIYAGKGPVRYRKIAIVPPLGVRDRWSTLSRQPSGVFSAATSLKA